MTSVDIIVAKIYIIIRKDLIKKRVERKDLINGQMKEETRPGRKERVGEMIEREEMIGIQTEGVVIGRYCSQRVLTHSSCHFSVILTSEVFVFT